MPVSAGGLSGVLAGVVAVAGAAGGGAATGAAAAGASSSLPIVTVCTSASGPTRTSRCRICLPGALASTRCVPGSTGMRVPHTVRPSAMPSRSTVSAGRSTSGGTTTTSTDSFGMIALRCSSANDTRSPRCSRSAIARASRNSTIALAVSPSRSWHAARLSTVPGSRSSRRLSSSLRHASGTLPCESSTRPSSKRVAARALS